MVFDPGEFIGCNIRWKGYSSSDRTFKLELVYTMGIIRFLSTLGNVASNTS